MTSALAVRCVRTRQGGADLYAFFMPGRQVLEIADITRLGQDAAGQLAGFQRPEIRHHVKAIAEYLDQGDVLFPNAIILALAQGVRFSVSRGPKRAGADPGAVAGTLSIPIGRRKAGWIVDGQQRALALALSRNADIMVPVVAFVSSNLGVHREQFILVNKARPLSPRLIDELLPEVDGLLPRDLANRKVPSALCSALNDHPDSPFHELIKRPSKSAEGAVVTDSSLIRTIRRSIRDPRGALAAFVDADGSFDADAMYQVLAAFWRAVRETFPDAWGLPPEKSRLMHAAGIEAMGVLMDQVMSRCGTPEQGYDAARRTLASIAPACRWMNGRWEPLGRAWNDIQYTPRDVRLLANHLIALEREAARAVA